MCILDLSLRNQQTIKRVFVKSGKRIQGKYMF